MNEEWKQWEVKRKESQAGRKKENGWIGLWGILVLQTDFRSQTSE